MLVLAIKFLKISKFELSNLIHFYVVFILSILENCIRYDLLITNLTEIVKNFNKLIKELCKSKRSFNKYLSFIIIKFFALSGHHNYQKVKLLISKSLVELISCCNEGDLERIHIQLPNEWAKLDFKRFLELGKRLESFDV